MVKGPVPAEEVQVNCPAPETQNGPFAVKLPCGNGLTVVAVDEVAATAVHPFPLV